MPEESSSWDPLHARIAALSPQQRVRFALACAEHLVTLEASPRQADLMGLIDGGWAHLADPEPNLSVVLNSLDARDDLDDDEVACVFYALKAVHTGGSDISTRRAAQRAIDAAYERVVYPESATTLRPLDKDAASPVVQRELVWQATALSVVETLANLAHARQRLSVL